MIYSNGMKAQYYYDEASRLSGIDIVDKKSNIIKKYIYTRDKVGRPTTIEETSPNGAVKTTHYSYDEVSRLIGESIEDSKGSINYSYTYDEVGNRTSLVVETSGSIKGLCDNAISIRTGETKYSYNDNNQLISEEYNGLKTLYSYDDNGNLIQVESGNNIQKYEYNAENKMSSYKNSAGREFKYIYDAEGNRIGKSVDGCLTKYVITEFNSLGYVLLELDADDKVIKHYTIADELNSFEYDDSTYCYVNNGHGDVAFITDESGSIVNTYSYNAYGTALICDEKVPNAFRYTGEYYDAETGLYYLRARYMNPATGTFTQEDTYQGNIYDALSLHKYLYAQDNPVIYKDPTGNDVSIVGLLTTVGSWAMETARVIWAAIKAIKAIVTWEAIKVFCTIRSITDQIKGLLTADKWYEWVDSLSGLALTIIGIFVDCLQVRNAFRIMLDFSGLAIDLLKLVVNLIEHKYKNLRSNLVDIFFDLLELLADAKIKDKKALEDLKKRYKRNEQQLSLIDLTKEAVANDIVPEDVIDILFKFANEYDSFDDVFIILFHT